MLNSGQVPWKCAPRRPPLRGTVLASLLQIGSFDLMLRNAPVDSSRRAGPLGSRVPYPALVVVARSHPGLHGYLAQCFSGTTAIRVITDRRLGDRRHKTRERTVECRRSARRGLTDADDALRCHGYVIVG